MVEAGSMRVRNTTTVGVGFARNVASTSLLLFPVVEHMPHAAPPTVCLSKWRNFGSVLCLPIPTQMMLLFLLCMNRGSGWGIHPALAFVSWKLLFRVNPAKKGSRPFHVMFPFASKIIEISAMQQYHLFQ